MDEQDKTINIGPEGNINPVVVAKVRFENFHSEIVVLDDYCTNSKCNCRDITLSFCEIVDGMIDDKLFEIKMNVDSWEMLKYEVFRQGIGCEAMIKEFLRKLDDQTKLIFKKRFENGKKFGGDYLKDNIDYATLSKSNCLRYNDIFNAKKFDKFIFEHKGTKYFVIDVYCINPSCDCNDVVLIFHELDFKKGLYVLKFDVRLDFSTAQYKVENKINSIEDLEVERIYKYFKKNLNDLNYKMLKERYARMKNLDNILEQNLSGLNYAKNLISKNIEGTKVGRNDPCPCGSGKKYKKCCGG